MAPTPTARLQTSSCSAARLVWTAGGGCSSRTSTTPPAMRYLNENCKTCERRQKVTPDASSVSDLHAPCCGHVPRIPTHPVPGTVFIDARRTVPGRTGGHLNFVHFPYINIIDGCIYIYVTNGLEQQTRTRIRFDRRPRHRNRLCRIWTAFSSREMLPRVDRIGRYPVARNSTRTSKKAHRRSRQTHEAPFWREPTSYNQPPRAPA